MDIFLYVAALGAGFILLIKGSDYFIDGAASLAHRLGISELIIGLTIVAMGTSAPEAAVSITAALKHSSGITIGNIVGSNILNILLILGVSAMVSTLTIKRSTVLIEIPFMIFCSIVLVALGHDGTIQAIEALTLWILFLIYISYLILQNVSVPDSIKSSPSQNQCTNQIHQKVLSIWKILFFVIGGLIAVILGSQLVVYGATGIARAIFISERVIGLTIVALGTSLPELFTSVNAAKKKKSDLAIGNIVGSNIFNILFIIGTAGLITPIPYENAFNNDGVIMIFAGIILYLFAFLKRKLTAAHGVLMVILFAIYWGVVILI